jgi:hypothetical protein
MLLFITPLSHARETDRGTVIYEQEDLLVTVYGWTERPGQRLADFCSGSGKNMSFRSSYNVTVAYNVPHKERTKLMTPSYTEFVKEKVYPSLIKTCGEIKITEIYMTMRKVGEYTRQDWSESMTFEIADNGKSVTQTSYDPNPVAEANMSMEEITALMPSQTGSGALPSQKHGKKLFQDDKLTVYAREDLWCFPKNRSKGTPGSNAGLDIIVPVSYSELKSWLRTHYGNFDMKVIKPLAEEACYPGGGIYAKFYQAGQSAYLEEVSYGWQKPRPHPGIFNPSPSNVKHFTVKSRTAGQTPDAKLAKIRKRKTERDVWRLPCKGKFCILPGGAYLQAIHDGDHSALKRMDGSVDMAISRWLRTSLGEAIAAKKHQDYSLLPVIADTYFYSYQQGFMLSCPDNLYKKTYRYKNPTFEMPDYGDFSMPDMGGEIDSATYVVPQEFLPLCDRICDAFGGSQDRLPIKSLNIKPARATLNSVYDIFKEYRCDQKEIKLFEKNLITLTEAYLNNKDSWLSKSDKQTIQRPIKPKAVERPPSPKPVQNVQPATKAPTPASEPESIDTSSTLSESNSLKPTPKAHETHSVSAPSKTENQMSEAKRYETMNAELAALSKTYTARLQNLSEEFQKNMLNVSDTTKRTEMLKEFQARMAELNAEARRETHKVKEKYNKK